MATPEERAKHIFASTTPRLATSIRQLAVAILYQILRIFKILNSDLKNEQKLRMFPYNGQIFGFLLPAESEAN